jgi:hypothetical protein
LPGFGPQNARQVMRLGAREDRRIAAELGNEESTPQRIDLPVQHR